MNGGFVRPAKTSGKETATRVNCNQALPLVADWGGGRALLLESIAQHLRDRTHQRAMNGAEREGATERWERALGNTSVIEV